MTLEVIQLNKTIRQVSSRLHFQWWEKLNMSSWQHLAKDNELIRQRLDNVILSRIKHQDFMLKEDIESIYKWLVIIDKLPALSIAAGLIVQGCPDYIWDTQYRQEMQQRFSQSEIEQLIALWPHNHHSPLWAPEEMLLKAEYFSASALYHLWNGHPFWTILSLSLPIVESPIELSQTENEGVVSWMFRLEKFL
ncbi:type III secretion system domain-containing protein [Vibrio hepatarius]|uniref:type III secretion system domain-containing protein n=1 Tax=Vibrio hepatarius TaxID=171383 RepID=UPI001C0A2B18|nr:type III secretion system domain-containing protein [Vibrio hepatarius]MBU2898911.1 hypothetical protein [Vibrio hepatarius]